MILNIPNILVEYHFVVKGVFRFIPLQDHLSTYNSSVESEFSHRYTSRKVQFYNHKFISLF